jgi:hypothetical protein
MLAVLRIPHTALNVMESPGNDRVGNVGRYPHLPNPFRQDPMDFASHCFLIADQQAQDSFRVYALKFG